MNEALRLAEIWSDYWPAYHYGQVARDTEQELRRLAAVEAQRDEARRTAREAHEAGTRLTAQRDALLEACRAMLTFIERHAPRGLQPEPGSPVAMARAAIKAVEEQK